MQDDDRPTSVRRAVDRSTLVKALATCTKSGLNYLETMTTSNIMDGFYQRLYLNTLL